MQRLFRLLSIISLSLVIAACATKPPAQSPAGVGQYRVVRGDTLTKIARDHGQSVESLMRMNKIINPNHLRVGQILTVRGGTATSSATPAAPSVSGQTVLPPASGPMASIAAPRQIKLIWPLQGENHRGTSTSNSQGVYIRAKKGTPVKAAASGEVVYAGSGLRGYGNMLIINHDANFLTIYAHNDALLVNAGDKVRQGDQVARVGNTGTQTDQLYFELRYNGKPVDVRRHLP